MNSISIAIIAAVVLLDVVGLGVYLALERRQTVVEERLGRLSQTAQVVAAPALPSRAASPLGERLNRALAGRGFAERIQRDLARADVKLNVAEYLALHVILGLAGFGLGFVIDGGVGLMAILGALAGFFLPRFYIGRQQGSRLRRFDGQLGDMLNLVVNGLRAGYSIMQALESVGRELPPPISDEFRRVIQEVQLGLPQEAALANLTRRVPSPDLDFVVTAVNVQREVGGNLSEILDNISYTIRERVRIKGEIATLTAQGQITAWVISLTPIILALILYVLNRNYLMSFFGPPMVFGLPLCGLTMLAVALIMIVSGFLIVQKIVDIEI